MIDAIDVNARSVSNSFHTTPPPFSSVLNLRPHRSPRPRRRRPQRAQTAAHRAVMSGSPPHYSSLNIHNALDDPSLPLRQERVRPSNASAYTLETIARAGPSTPRSCSPASRLSVDTDRTPLLDTSRDESRRGADYGSAPMPMSPNPNVSSKKILLNAGMKMAALFIISTVILGGTLWLALPPLEE